MVGVSRVKQVGEELTWEGQSKQSRERYGEHVWARVIQSQYPEQGMRIPYHKYLDNEEVLSKIVLTPENPRDFKYGTRPISDDGALDLIERFIEIAGYLKEIEDDTENWGERIKWLSSVIAELWRNRGLYPGLLKVLDYMEFHEAIQFYKDKVTDDPDSETKLKKKIFDFLKEGKEIEGLRIDENRKRKILRQWELKIEVEWKLLETVLPHFDLTKVQIERILSEKRKIHGIYSSLDEIINNPYILCEEYVGDGLDDFISFNKIDHGIFPSPELGGEIYPSFDKDDGRRLRVLCVGQLRKESQHAFVSAEQMINKINHKLSYLPDWKRHQFNIRYLEVDEEVLSQALTIREKEGKIYLYLKTTYEYERGIEKQIRNLTKRPDIKLRSPVTGNHWRNFLYDSDNPIQKKNPEKYAEIVSEQEKICTEIFTKPISVISGGAGTGKTTIIRAMIQAIEKAHGSGATIQLLAPTGKAADRLRDVTERSVLTIHSFLTARGWLNDNWTFKLEGGQQEEAISAIIIDESSMLDLAILGTLFRAIKWGTVKRLIFVGDPNQLPPIGTGKVFADILDWLRENYPENVGVLETNVRQLLNQLEDKGTGISELTSLYVRKQLTEQKDNEMKFKVEEILKKVQEGGEVDKDLRVVYWNELDDFYKKLTDTIINDLETDTGLKYNHPDEPFDIYAEAFKIRDNNKDPEYMQIISPYRGEFFGVDNLNLWIQERFNKSNMENHGVLNGISYFDKVIQYRNRTKSNPIRAYNTQTGTKEDTEIFNGEIGFVKPHGFDRNWGWNNFRLSRFQVVFKRKEHLWVEFNSKSRVEGNLELAYAISVHKSQGSEFNRVYFILPKHKKALLTTELFYTGVTRAKAHCTIFIEEDISPLLTLSRPEYSQLNRINSSLFEFRPVPEELLNLSDWYEEGKIHKTLADIMVRSKSEAIIANLLSNMSIPFKYEVPLYASDGTFYLPDFTIMWNGEEWYWEHLGMLDNDRYRNHWKTKKEWYEKQGFSKRLIITDEKKGIDSKKFEQIIQKHFG